ncbi:MAG: hypothetical protein HYU28_11685 [Actinobacteria bacterium]|nr:hypothetical protein [Actinomycetota bacterium]
MDAPAASAPTEFRPAFARFLRLWAWATVAGILAGVLVFGVGGRIAMRILAVTSSDAVQGAFTDDGLEIGEVTLEGTIGLILFGGIFGGVIGGWFYAIIRQFLPTTPTRRRWAGAAIGVAIGTQLFVDSEGRDFSILEPIWLPVALFVLLSGLFGFLVPLIADRLRNWYETTPLRFPRFLAFAPLLLVIPTGIGFVVGLAVCALGAVSTTQSRPSWVTPAGRVLLVAVLAYTASIGVREVTEIERRDPKPSDFVEPEFD